MNVVRRILAFCIAIAAVCLLIFCISDATIAIKTELGVNHAKQCSDERTKNCLNKTDEIVQEVIRTYASMDDYAIRFNGRTYKTNEELHSALKAGSVIQVTRYNGRIYTVSKGRITHTDESFADDVARSGFNIALLIATIVVLLWALAERGQQEKTNLLLLCGMLALNLIVTFATATVVNFLVCSAVVEAVVTWIAVFVACNAMDCYLSCGRGVQSAGE